MDGSMIDSDSSDQKPVLHVECCLLPKSTCRYDVVRRNLDKYLHDTSTQVFPHTEIKDYDDSPFLRENVEFIKICEARGNSSDIVSLASVTLQIHVYQLNEEDSVDEYGEEDAEVSTASNWILPSRGLDGVWDRVALLHGPPGTGKTSLARALAQKLAIRLADRYSHGKLVEINSHSLFSKWFSESGKLVMRMFQQISELIADEDAFVCVLIDEVESLTAARKAALSGAEPSDAVRVVNALLTQIDKLKNKKNVLILATSNITEAIDLAFIDRADIKQYIGLPSPEAIYAILATCLKELMRVGIVDSAECSRLKPLYSFCCFKLILHVQLNTNRDQLADWRTVELFQHNLEEHVSPSRRLFAIAKQCEGMSGRSMRKLPFLAHSHYLQVPFASLDTYLTALERTAKDEHRARQLIGIAGNN
ncbi:P-loop containing nucleoside triphosphate hydrolase protein [Endogone sp. FLAS-F59071]|nr:P-loop containing nucleoside triphosphate hydrolase protein [Endogone sp. FLAS-F59071]|eukprot:RUS14475.1 P-loop containing nucleoside triphosphate hydrolase protein [Endogone sp. FLAS-F59071]